MRLSETAEVEKKSLGEMLVAANLIDEVQMRIALAEQHRTGKRFGSTLVELKFVDENVLAAFLSRQVEIPCISLLHVDIPKKVLKRLSTRLARDLHAIPIRWTEGRFEVAMTDPTDPASILRLEEELGGPVTPLIAPQSSVEKMLDRFYQEEPDDTLAARRHSDGAGAGEPIFLDLIEEIENGSYEQRLSRIEESLNQIWTLLEKILRQLEATESPRVGSRR